MKTASIKGQIAAYLKSEILNRGLHGVYVTTGYADAPEFRADNNFHIVVHNYPTEQRSIDGVLALTGERQHGVALHIMFDATSGAVKTIERSGFRTTATQLRSVDEVYADIRYTLNHHPMTTPKPAAA